jgi:steroid delta-isomerase-like uncharacterized protein
MGDKELRDLVRASIEAFNDADWDRWRKLHAPNIVYDEIATNRRLTGHTECVQGLKGWRQAFPDLKGTITNLVTSENQAVLEVKWEGTHKGDLKTPFGVIPPSYTHDVTRAILVLKVEKNLIIEDRHYFDFMTVLRQAGMIPEMKSKAAGA